MKAWWNINVLYKIIYGHQEKLASDYRKNILIIIVIGCYLQDRKYSDNFLSLFISLYKLSNRRFSEQYMASNQQLCWFTMISC